MKPTTTTRNTGVPTGSSLQNHSVTEVGKQQQEQPTTLRLDRSHPSLHKFTFLFIHRMEQTMLKTNPVPLKQSTILSLQEEEETESSSSSSSSFSSDMMSIDSLRTHAGIATNLGRLLYFEGYLVTAMYLYQEALQSLMFLDYSSSASSSNFEPSSGYESNSKDKTSLSSSFGWFPSQERHEEMVQLLSMLSSCLSDGPSDHANITRQGLCDVTRKLFVQEGPAFPSEFKSKSICHMNCNVYQHYKSTTTNAPITISTTTMAQAGGFPGLFKSQKSKLRVGAEQAHLTGLTFCEPFRIDVHHPRHVEFEPKHFIIPLEECPKATLFNMGLIHYYHWGNIDTALRFFDMASSMSQQLSPLEFDPVILASFNNKAQILLQYGRADSAMELLQDALTRGNAALTAIYGNQDADWKAAASLQSSTEFTSPPIDARFSRRLRRKLARTVMNIGHVHYFNCEYAEAMATCHEALRLLQPHTPDLTEVASIWHNMGVILYHQNHKERAVEHLQKFIDQVKLRQRQGNNHALSLQLAEAYALQGVAIYEMGKLYECMAPLNEALRIRMNLLEPNHPAIAESFCSIGRVLQAREEYDFCLKAFQKGMSILRENAGNDQECLSFEAAQTLLDMGRALHIQNRIAEAIQVYQEATQVTSQFFGDKSVFVARLHNIVANLHLELGQVDRAVEYFQREMDFHLQLGGLPATYFTSSGMAEDPLCCMAILQHYKDDFPTAPMA